MQNSMMFYNYAHHLFINILSGQEWDHTEQNGREESNGFYKKARESLLRAKSPDDSCLKESFWNLVQETRPRTNTRM